MMLPLILVFLFAFLLDFLLGDPHTKWHPVALTGRFASVMETLCRKVSDGICAGAAGWLILVGICTFSAWITTWAACRVNVWSGGFSACVWLYFSIALRSLIDHAEAIRRPLSRGDLPEARRALSMIVSRDTAELDASSIIRGAIESLGENGIDGVNSALFWAAAGYFAFGLPGLASGAVFLRAANTLDACWGYRNERYEKFGKTAARMDDLLHWIPARLTMFSVAFASSLCGGKLPETLRTAIRHRKDHPSPNSCYGMASFAGALGIRLGGPTVYAGEIEPYPFWGNGRAELETRDLLRAERLTAASSLVFGIMMLGGAWLWILLTKLWS